MHEDLSFPINFYVIVWWFETKTLFLPHFSGAVLVFDSGQKRYASMQCIAV